MSKILIENLNDLEALDLSNFEVTDDIDIEIKFKVFDEKIVKPIKIIHSEPDLQSKIYIKLALYGKASVEIPVEIWVKEGAKNTSTNFKALIYLMTNSARANITPGLFIHEKEIASAGHGVVIKSIKDKDTFYLQSRGIPNQAAKELIVGI